MDAIYWLLYFASPFGIWGTQMNTVHWTSLLFEVGSAYKLLRGQTHLRYSSSNLLFAIIWSTTSIPASSLISQRSLNYMRSDFLTEPGNSDRGRKCFLKAHNVWRETKLHPNYQPNEQCHWEMPSGIAARHVTFISSASWSRVRCSFSLSLKLTSCIFSV